MHADITPLSTGHSQALGSMDELSLSPIASPKRDEPRWFLFAFFIERYFILDYETDLHFIAAPFNDPKLQKTKKSMSLFACTKCKSRHPFDELSKGDQLCKVSWDSTAFEIPGSVFEISTSKMVLVLSRQVQLERLKRIPVASLFWN